MNNDKQNNIGNNLSLIPERVYVEERFEHSGYPCVIAFVPAGHRTGYVGLPKDHKYYGEEEYNDYDVYTHGGVTYADHALFTEEEDNDLWWVGFDCAHAGDGKDLPLALHRFPNQSDDIRFLIEMDKRFDTSAYETLRSHDYVKEEVISLANQLVSIQKERDLK